MPDGKVRSDSHLIDARALQYLASLLPIEWVQRTMVPDYGIDIDLEMFDYEDGQCVTLGEHLFIQVKGTEHASFRKIPAFRESNTQLDQNEHYFDVLKFPIDVALLKLTERMGSTIPVLLVVVDLIAMQAYYICLNDYIKNVLPIQKPNYRNQTTVTVYIPSENIINSEGIGFFKWFSKRAKLYGLFQELLSAVDDIKYCDEEERIRLLRKLVSRVVFSDAWTAGKYWAALAILHQTIQEMYDNNMVSNIGQAYYDILYQRIIKECSPNHIDESISNLQKEAQELSCNYLIESIQVVCSDFENSVRHVGLPTEHNAIMSR